jgi:hypothetical protein
MNDLMEGLYARVTMSKAMITPNEIILLVRDYHRRLEILEEENARLKATACDRSGTCGLSDEDVSSS